MASSALSQKSGPSWANPDDHNNTLNVQQQDNTVIINDNDILLEPYSTLEEPVLETILRDVRAVYAKLRVVMLPLDREAPLGYNAVSSTEEEIQVLENQKKVIDSLKDWDLWGPLVVCLGLSVMLSFKAPTNQASLVFAAVFTGIWLGSSIVTLNAQLLGSTISFFQSLCVLGYCVFPLLLAAVIIGLLKLTPISWMWLDFIFIAIAFLWATRASSVFFGIYISRDKRALAVFPVFFFYTFLGWLILLF